MDRIAAVVKEKIQQESNQGNTKLFTAVGDIENRVAALESSEQQNVVKAKQLGQRISAVETVIMEQSVAAEARQPELGEVSIYGETDVEEEQCLETPATAVGQPSASCG